MNNEEIKNLQFGSEVVWHSRSLEEEKNYIKKILRVDMNDRNYPNQTPTKFGLGGVGNNHPRNRTSERYNGSVTLWDGRFVNKIDLEEFKKNYRIVKI